MIPYKLRQTCLIELEKGKLVRWHRAEFEKSFVQMYGNLSAIARQWRKFGAVFRLRVRKRNSANSLI